MAGALDRLLRPKSIAVIGGGAWCENVIDQCEKIGFSGPIWPVHPTRRKIQGRAAFATVESLPAAPDAAFIGVNRHATIEVVRSLRKRGAGGAVCFASGFLEARAEAKDGADLTDALLEAAGEMRIIGPNCYGLINYLDGALLWPDQHGGARVESGVAIVAQSSNIALNITMQRRGLPLAYVVTCGNQAQTGIAEIGRAMLDDPRVTALGLYIEGIGDVRAFETLAADARRLDKTIVALKIGRSEQARRATISHTASLAGDDAAGSALLERLGIARIATLPEFLETLKLLHVGGPLISNRIASLSCSGGEASLMADLAVSRALTYPPITKRQEKRLRAALGPMVALANPLDYHTYIWNDRRAMAAAFAAMMDASADLALAMIVMDLPRTDRCSAQAWEAGLKAVIDAYEQSGVPTALVVSLPENLPEEVAARMTAACVAPLCGMAEALIAAESAAWLGAPWVQPAPILLPAPTPGGFPLNEAQAKAALAAQGVAIPRSERADSVDGAVAAAERLGYPVVLKQEGAAHKTESGAVRLNLTNADAVRAAAEAMTGAPFLIEEMIGEGVLELLIGVTLDPAHGYLLTLGAGGVRTEIWRDKTHLLLPVAEDDIMTALGRLKIAPILEGYRGAPPVDQQAIVAAVLAVQAYVQDHIGAVSEVEINPLICGPDRAVAADALVIQAPQRQGECR
ncbi:MAG: acetate--CoA ligase family protein [Alphaproteobacteria bacterium]|nr:acetate--CoA ligase family protein [Alphaproteobacteria bacterium]